MYLRGSEWSMRRKKRHSNPLTVLVLLALVAAMVYVNQVIVPDVQLPGVPTATPTRDPESYLTEAEALFNEGKLLQAIDIYKQAIPALPADASIYIDMARAQIYAGLYKDAQVSAENALLLNNKNAMAHALRGWALFFQGDTLNALTSINTALENDPNNAMAHAFLAELLAEQYANGNAEIDTLEKMSNESNMAISLAPNSIEAHRARGYVLEVTDNRDQAIQEYEKAISINPNIADLHAALGRVYYGMEVYDKAFDSFSRAYSLNPSDTTPNAYIARIYARRGEYAKAVQYAEQTVRDDPTNGRWRGLLGVMYYRNGQDDKAVEQLAYVAYGGKTEDGQDVPALDLGLNDYRISEYYSIFGLSLVRLGRCGEAIPIFDKILNTVPDDPNATYNAQEGLRLCTENVGVEPTAGPTPEESATPEITPTP